MRERPFEVRPVRRYTLAKYPSHRDPDPCSYPDTVPFPFSRAVISAVAGLGVAAGGAGCGPEEDTEGGSKVGERRSGASTRKTADGEALTNPFTLDRSGLPYRSSMFGTGQPSYIQDDLARKVIDRVFREEGIELARKHPLKDKEVEVVLDGFEPSSGFGYFFARFQNLENDAFVHWAITTPLLPTPDEVRRARSRLKAELERSSPERIESMRRRMTQLGVPTGRVRLPESSSLEYARAMEAALATEDDAAFRDAYSRVQEIRRREGLSLAEAVKLIERAERGDQYVAVISQFDLRYAQPGFSTSRLSELQRAKHRAIGQIEDPVEKAAARKKFAEELARAAVERLERDVRQYIRWARSQGL